MTKKARPTARFKARYGMKGRKAVDKIETQMKLRHTCPKCEYPSVKRTSVGIWRCRKCGYTFAGGAYTPLTRLGKID